MQKIEKNTKPSSQPSNKHQRLEQLFEVTALRTPHHPCVDVEGRIHTYRDIHQKALALASLLQTKGIKPGCHVGVCLAPGPDLYVALLGILGAGAVFVPLDAGLPSERIRFIVEDASLECVLHDDSNSNLSSMEEVPCLNVHDLDLSRVTLDPEKPPVDPEAICYICYTSGTTGRPKGVVIRHSSIVNFVRIATNCYEFRSEDRVFQGMSAAFDFSVEEIWTTFYAGATLVPRPSTVDRLGPGLNDFLIDAKVSILTCVPTLLASLDQQIPSLRILNIGGEACPPTLVERWAREGLKILNTYGPTEATVTATWTELKPGRPVSIGHPLPSYDVYLLDPDLREVDRGDVGEICIAGPGLAEGYLNRPDLTRERFISFQPSIGGQAIRLYRTGDLGRLFQNEEIEYLGRMDDQVKINGFRVELAEIEETLREFDGVGNAAVTTWTEGGQTHLVGYLVLLSDQTETPPPVATIRAWLEAQLPAYMVPSFLEILESLPTMVSGKIDRRALPPPRGPSIDYGPRQSLDVLQEKIHGIWCEVLGCEQVPLDANFFTDLGGHSLLAAQMVSLLRRMPLYQKVSMGELYEQPTLRSFCAHLATHFPSGSAHVPLSASDQRPQRVSSPRYIGMGVLQLAFLTFYLGIYFAPMGWILHGINWDQPFWEGLEGLQADLQSITSAPTPFESALIHQVWLLALPLLLLIQSFLLPVLVQWSLIGRLMPGRYPLWGSVYFRWWASRRMMLITPLNLLAGTPILNRYLNLLGARIDPAAYLATPSVESPELVHVAAGAMIGYQVSIQPYQISEGWLHLGEIHIGPDAVVGAKSLILPDARIGRGGILGNLSLLDRGARVLDGQSWSGSPAVARPSPDQFDRSLRSRAIHWTIAHQVGQLIGILILFAIPYACSISTLYLVSGLIQSWGYPLIPLVVVLAGLSFTVQLCVVIASIKLLLPRLGPGLYPVASHFGLSKWLSDKLVEMSLFFLNPLYSTLYTPLWLRMLGAKVGPRAEISTVSDIDPDLLTLGEECFIADMAVIGPAAFYLGYFQIAETHIGRRSFIGNAAVVPANTIMKEATLLGVSSTPSCHSMAYGTSWLGSPAIYLPRREVMAMEESVTYHPSRLQVVIRLLIEFFRITLPPGLLIFATSLLLEFYESNYFLKFGAEAVIAYELLLVLEVISLVLVVILFKWLLIGRYRPRTEPNWSYFVRRTEFVTALYENIPVPLLLDWLQGTPWIGLLLRLFGAKVGRRVFLDSTFLTEFDLVHIGDDCHVGHETSLQTHLFEDRVMKMSTVRLEDAAGVGSHSVILYDAIVEKGAEISELSLVMKGETIPERTHWTGLPARPA